MRTIDRKTGVLSISYIVKKAKRISFVVHLY